MYLDLTDEANRVRILQRLLRYLSFAWEEPLLRVSISGEYTEETRRAVRFFQEGYGRPVTGVVDPVTWEAMTEAYRAEEEKREPVWIRAVPPGVSYETVPGEESDTAALLQILLRALSVRYDYAVPPLDGIYGPDTEKAVRRIQKTAGLPDTGKADRETWLLLAEEYNTLPAQR